MERTLKRGGLLQNGKVHQDIVCCSQTEAYILYEKLTLQQPPRFHGNEPSFCTKTAPGSLPAEINDSRNSSGIL
ncbi:hypothetical protein AALB64_15195 [Lachnospiraceae bacterium 45-P1]